MKNLKTSNLDSFQLDLRKCGKFCNMAASYLYDAYPAKLAIYTVLNHQESFTQMVPHWLQVSYQSSDHSIAGAPHPTFRYDMPAPQGWTGCIARNETKYFRLQVWSWCGWNQQLKIWWSFADCTVPVKYIQSILTRRTCWREGWTWFCLDEWWMVGTKAEFLLKWMVSDHRAANCPCVCLESPCCKTAYWKLWTRSYRFTSNVPKRWGAHISSALEVFLLIQQI